MPEDQTLRQDMADLREAFDAENWLTIRLNVDPALVGTFGYRERLHTFCAEALDRALAERFGPTP